MKKIVGGAIKFILFLVFALSVAVLITSKTPIIGGIRSYVVLTGSMEPTIPTGSIVFTKKSVHYQNGDVITYQSGNISITHRVQSVSQKDGSIVYKTKGDANASADSLPIAEKDVLGKTVFYLPLIGRVVMALKTLPGFVLIIVLPAVIFILSEILHIKKAMEKDIEKKLALKMQLQGDKKPN